jgi:hypothetical protein
MPNEAGIGALRVNFVRETTPGTTPTNPAWLRFSDEISSVGGWAPNTNLAARTAVGSPDVQGFSIGAEDHELSITYALQRWLTAATETPLDAIADGLYRDANGYIKSRHSFLARQDLPAPAGVDAKGVRVYTYGTGGVFQSATLSGDPGSGEPVAVEGSYRFEHMRSYKINQPNVGTTLKVVSSNAADTSQTLTIETDGASTSETISLNGTTLVTGSSSFATIDSFRLSAACEGDVTVTFTTGASECFVIVGKDNQQEIGGDLGMALLGSGSFEAALSSAFEHILGDTITKGGSAIDTNVMTMSIAVANNIEATPVTRQKAKVLSEGMRDITADATVFSESGSHSSTVDHLKATAGDIVWTMAGGTITLNSAVLTGPGARQYEKGNATMQRGNTFTATDLTITP